MKKMQCELCGSIDIIKIDKDCFQCQHCGCKYTLEQAKMLISGVVEVVQGQAELDRMLKNAAAQIRYGAYEAAEEIYRKLGKEYPDRNIVWNKYMACHRAVLLSGKCMLDGERAQQMYQILKRQCISAETPEKRAKFMKDDELFWKELFKKHESEKPCVKEIDVFHAIYFMREHGVMPKDCISTALWDLLVRAIDKKFRAKTYTLISQKGHEGYDTALLKYSYDLTKNYDAIMLLEDMHPRFAALIKNGRENAKKLNARSVRVGWNHQGDLIWVKGGLEELSDLYVDFKFALLGRLIGDYRTFKSYSGTYQDGLHKNIDLSDKYAQLRKRQTPEQAFEWWNKSMSRCPFCDGHMKMTLSGRKCTYCKRKIPKM